MTPGDALWWAGGEVILLASSLEQARIVFRVVRTALEPLGGYRWVDSTQRIGCTHLATNTRLTSPSAVMPRPPWDFRGQSGGPGRAWAFDVVGGEMMADALFTAQGKPDSALKLLMIGTLAPMATAAGHWYYDLVHAGTKGRSTFKRCREMPTPGTSGPPSARQTRSPPSLRSSPQAPGGTRRGAG